jgi:uncharacterized protein (TIGR03435 family)
MFRNMFEDEFKLKLRKDVKEDAVYGWSVDKPGLKMKRDEEPWDFDTFHQIAADTGAGSLLPAGRPLLVHGEPMPVQYP